MEWLLSALLIAFVVCIVSLSLYRMWFHPLAHIPGPKLAAITRYYEAYYDVIQKGQYTFKIRQLHERYGPILRISPHEIHISDPQFFDQVYRDDGAWNKYDWACRAFDAPGAIVHTIDHNVHKQRRGAIDAFFSRSAAIKKHGMVQNHVQSLFRRIDQFAHDRSVINIGGALTALTYDVATDFVLGASYGLLAHPTFNVLMTNVLQDGGAHWRLAKHVPFYCRVLKLMPRSFVEQRNPASGEWFRFSMKIHQTAEETIEANRQKKSHDIIDEDEPQSLVDVILQSELPAEEKEPSRIMQDLSTIIKAGTETTGNALRTMLFYVYTDPRILRTLRKELTDAGVCPIATPLTQLVQLPYLTAVLTETLRLTPALATRSARISPTETIVYNRKCAIPPGTPIGMTVFNMHMDPKLHPDPTRFDPQRWMAITGKQPFWAPFSRGTRMCLGTYLAWAEMYITFAALVLVYDFEFERGVGVQDFECIRDNHVLSTSRVNGMTAHVSLRNA